MKDEIMESPDRGKIVFDRSVIDFVTVAVEFCAFLENEEKMPRSKWVDRMLKILPILYVKALLLPDVISSDEDLPATFVREEDYNRVASSVANIMGEENVYLDVFVSDMKYSDTPVSAFISENVADIYQDIRNFVSVYQLELTEQMYSALYLCRENFNIFWGQKLVNVLRPLHALKIKEMELPGEEGNLMGEELWD